MAAGERYSVADAKDWAGENFHGVCNVIIPSYTADLRDLNEAGIRHDVRRNIELGFWGALLVSEAGTRVGEMRRFMEIAVDEAAGQHYFVLHGSFDTMEDLIQVTADAKRLGVDAVLLSYPNSFYPTSVTELEDFVRHYSEHCELGIIVFSAPHFNLDRLDVRGYPLSCLLNVVDLPNVVAVKHEVGQPGVLGSYEVLRKLEGRNVIVTDPFEPNVLMWADLFDTPWVGTSNYEYLGSAVPEMFAHMRAGEREAAYKRYWQVQPARRMRMRLQSPFVGANFNHRYLWKYQAWLQGYNGGPIRQPAMKLTDDQMRLAAEGLIGSGLLDEAPCDFSQFFVGRKPA